MSVIELNLWINYQVLKSAHQQLHGYVTRALQVLYNQTMAMNEALIARLLAQINRRDSIIRQFQSKAEKENKYNSNCIQPTRNLGVLGNSHRNNEHDKMVREWKTKYDDVVRQNKQYEAEFVVLVDEMKSIKMYLEDFNRVRHTKSGEDGDRDSPAKQIINKISSLSRLQSIKLSGDLDIIREVTQVSAHSDQQQQDRYSSQQRLQFRQITEEELPAMSKLLMNSVSQSRSFECIHQVYDGNLLLDSRSISSKILVKNQTLEESLEVLKNYGSTQDISIVQSRMPPVFTIPLLQHLSLPILKLKDVVNQKHLIFQGGYVYTGNTVISVQGVIMPSGFGQLFLGKQLIYCGQWKHGVFDGWGKMHIRNSQTVMYFNGKWEQGLAHGPGTIEFTNLERFSGTFRYGVISGQGAYFKENKRIYQGYWQSNSLVRQEI